MPRFSHRTSTSALILSAAVLVGLSACSAGSEPSDVETDTAAAEVYERFASITGEEREQQLLQEAIDAGGEITIYTAAASIDTMVAAFEDKYPDLTVNTYRASPDTFLQRFFQEQEAGYHGVDVIEDANATLVTDRGMAGTYVNDELTSQIDGFEQVKGKLVPTFGTAWVVSWNTDKVRDDEIPTDFWDFADPKWEGRLSMTDADWPLYMTLSQRYIDEGRTQDEVDELFSTLASYSTIVSGHTLQAQLLAAGEFDVALTTFDSGVDRIAATGAPITWKGANGEAVQPVVVQLEGSVPIINAPNPAGALLWLDFELQQGQEVLASDHVYPVLPVGGENKFEGLTTAYVDFEAYLAERDTWEPAYREFLKQGSPADS